LGLVIYVWVHKKLYAIQNRKQDDKHHLGRMFGMGRLARNKLVQCPCQSANMQLTAIALQGFIFLSMLY
jgi:hypothetical protein